MTNPGASWHEVSWHDVLMSCGDGTRLISRLWTPPGVGPWPALLMRQPYHRAIASTVTYAHPLWYAQHGFLVVVQDVRGQGDSEGTFQGFAQEASDGAETLRWLRQLSECNGRIGTYGFSYQGLTQLLNDAAEGEKEALPDCLAPAMAGLDERLHWASEGGAHWWALGLGWGLQLAAQRCQYLGDQAGWMQIRTSLESGNFLREGIPLLERHDPDGMALSWLRRDPLKRQGWTIHAPSDTLLRLPMLLLGGWHDPHLRGVLDLFQRSLAAGGRPQLRLGAWTHLDWPGGADALHLAFFQHHLQDKPPVDWQGANLSAQASLNGPWQNLEPACFSPGPRWILQGEKLIEEPLKRVLPGSVEPPAAPTEPTLPLVHDPWRAVPGRGGHLDLQPGAKERTDLDARRDVACFTAAPLSRPTALVGRPQLAIPVQADQPGFDLCACLSVVRVDGSVHQLSTGVARFLGEHCRENQVRHLELQPLMATLESGECLRLSVAASAWPQIAINPGDGSVPLGGASPRHRVITLTFNLPPDNPSQACASLQVAPLLHGIEP